MTEELLIRLFSDMPFAGVVFYVLIRICPNIERMANSLDRLERRIERLEEKILEKNS